MCCHAAARVAGKYELCYVEVAGVRFGTAGLPLGPSMNNGAAHLTDAVHLAVKFVLKRKKTTPRIEASKKVTCSRIVPFVTTAIATGGLANRHEPESVVALGCISLPQLQLAARKDGLLFPCDRSSCCM